MVTADVPPFASSAPHVTLSASATVGCAQPYTYTWSWYTTNSSGQVVFQGGATGQTVQHTFPAHVNPWQVIVTAASACASGYSPTYSLASSAPTTVAVAASTPAGQPLTGDTPVQFSRRPWTPIPASCPTAGPA